MNIQNTVTLANIEAEIDTLEKLDKLGCIEPSNLEGKLGDIVVKFKAFYDEGKIDDALKYEMAVNISDKIVSLDKSGEGWWSLYQEANYHSDLPSLKEVLSESLYKKQETEDKLARDSSTYRVYVAGERTAPLDDMSSFAGSYQSRIVIEAGTGANTINDVIGIVKDFQDKTNAENKLLIDDNFERGVGYFIPATFTVENKQKAIVFGGLWDGDNKNFFIPSPLEDKQYKELTERMDSLKEKRGKAAFSDNRGECENIDAEFEKVKIQVVNTILSKTDMDKSEMLGVLSASLRNDETQEQRPSSIFKLTGNLIPESVSTEQSEKFCQNLQTKVNVDKDNNTLVPEKPQPTHTLRM